MTLQLSFSLAEWATSCSLILYIISIKHLQYFLLFSFCGHHFFCVKLTGMTFLELTPILRRHSSASIVYRSAVEFPVDLWIGSAQTWRINKRLCAECVLKKKKLWSFSTRKTFKALMCFVCEWPVDLVVNSVLHVVASIHRQVYLQKQFPLCPTDPHPTPVHPQPVKQDC